MTFETITNFNTNLAFDNIKQLLGFFWCPHSIVVNFLKETPYLFKEIQWNTKKLNNILSGICLKIIQEEEKSSVGIIILAVDCLLLMIIGTKWETMVFTILLSFFMFKIHNIYRKTHCSKTHTFHTFLCIYYL